MRVLFLTIEMSLPEKDKDTKVTKLVFFNVVYIHKIMKKKNIVYLWIKNEKNTADMMHKHKWLQLFYTVPAIVNSNSDKCETETISLLCVVSIRGNQACQSKCYCNKIYFHISECCSHNNWHHLSERYTRWRAGNLCSGQSCTNQARRK